MNKPSSSTFFTDGKRLIDFVLVYEEKESNIDEDRAESTKEEERQIFEQTLLRLGLQIERANAIAINPNVKFVLIHAPFKVLMRQAELMMVRMPVLKNDVSEEWNASDGFVNGFLKRLKFLDFDPKVKRRIEPDSFFCQPFVAQHLDCFVGHESPDTFFSRADRSRMVHNLLIRARYDHDGKSRFGIDKLLSNNTYTAAFPLHDRLNQKAKHTDLEQCTDRQLLYESWVRMRNILKRQPLPLIRNYFGTKIAFYFAWLGYYTRCLWSVSMLGILVVLFGLFTMDRDTESNEICEGDIGRALICPICDSCDFVPINGTCLYTRITYVVDNWSTIVFAVVVSIWVTLFLEGWKRYHAELAYKWNVLAFEPEDEIMRPEFQFRRQTKRKRNPVTGQQEPYMPLMEKACRFCGSAVTVLFSISLVLALLFGIIVYRVIVRRVFLANTFSQAEHRILAIWVTSGTAATINLIFIIFMNFFYRKLALKLTAWECPRTQSDFDNSYTLKVFLFQFVNTYSSLFYIAFVKGRFVGPPRVNREWQCEAAGCMVGLVIQLSVIMIGKQILNTLFEISNPMISSCVRRWRLKIPETKAQKAKRHIRTKKGQSVVGTYERDYSLNVNQQQFLFKEYLEMVIQLGFVTIFVVAFPLAPLFALLNNIFEIRLDAHKFVVGTQRPVPEQARNIGIWLTIINMISNVAVLCNAFLIAFTTDFVPKLHFLVTQQTLRGYAEDTFAFFDSSDLVVRATQFPNASFCRYRDYRQPPCTLFSQLNRTNPNGWACNDNYELQPKWWTLLAFRLTFVLIFELVVLSIKATFAYMIPDVPSKILLQLQRERFLMRQAILQSHDGSEELLAAEVEGAKTSLDKSQKLDKIRQDRGAIDSVTCRSDVIATTKTHSQRQERRHLKLGFERLTASEMSAENRETKKKRRRPAPPSLLLRAPPNSTRPPPIGFTK
uniref:Anoctamin n=1 Tax=Globodera rostochiensis TaxID=31243 RepID=A0A914I139_GLORO